MGALGDSYAILADLKARLGGVSGVAEDAALTSALATATLGINTFCGRQFNKTTTASARVYDHGWRVRGPGVISKDLAFVDDFHTITDLVIKTDEDDDGVFETTWTSADYQLEPLNGIVDGETGWPFWKIRAVGSYRFPTTTRRAPLQTTAQWGWNAVPAVAPEVELMVAEEIYRLKDAPFGVAGTAEWGFLRVKENPMAASKLRRYQRDALLVGGG